MTILYEYILGAAVTICAAVAGDVVTHSIRVNVMEKPLVHESYNTLYGQ